MCSAIRIGTGPAAGLFQGAVAKNVISRQRARQLRSLGEEKRQTFLQTLIGIPQTVLFEQKKMQDWVGHTDNYVTITTTSGKDLKNVFAQVVPQIF